MIYRDVFRLLCGYFFYFSFLLLVPFFVGIYYQYCTHPEAHPQPHATFSFLISFFCSLSFSGILYFFSRNSKGTTYRKESILAVVLIWTLTPAVSALPYVFSGTLSNPLQAYFESVSGFTTTGATLLAPKKYTKEGNEELRSFTIPGEIPVTYLYYGTVPPVKNEKGEVIAEGIEAVSKSILFWRSFTQWLGGMGIIVLFIVVLPTLGIGGKLLINLEMAGPSETSLSLKIRETTSVLWKIYLFFTVTETVLLKLTNHKMPWFDAITIPFSTISTGGFSVRNTNIGFYQNGLTEWVVMGFMIIGSLSFSIWFLVIRGKIYRVFEREIIIYLTIIAFSCVFAAYSLAGTKQEMLTGEVIESFSYTDAFRNASFQIISAIATTGFSTTNFNIWPFQIQILMLVLMYVGGMAGSTSGGVKILRNYILFKTAQFNIESIFRPESVRTMETGNHRIGVEVSLKALCFFLVLITLTALSAFLFVIDGLDPPSALSLTGCMINNVGFAFRAYGPMHSCAFLSDFGMGLSCFLMIAGRLEFFAVLTLLVPSFWKQYT